MEVQHFHSGQLYSDEPQALQALRAGAIQLVAPTMSKLNPVMPSYALFDLPYSFVSDAMMKEVIESPDVGQKLFARLGEKGLKPLAVFIQGQRHLASRKQLIKTLDDVQGLKFRIQNSRVFAEFFKAAGAGAQVLPFAETYTAIQQGVIDGGEAPFTALYSVKWHEVAPYITTSGHMYATNMFVTNAKFWNDLPTDVRTGLEQILDEVTKWEWSHVNEAENEARRKAIAEGATVYDLPPTEKKKWAIHFRKVHKLFEATIGADILQALYKIADKY